MSAYGSVADWVYGVAAGILPRKDAPGYAKVTIAPSITMSASTGTVFS